MNRRLAVAIAFGVFGLIVLSTLVVAEAVMLYNGGWRIAWGTVPDWIAGFGGLATVGAFVVAWLLYNHEVQARVDDEFDRVQNERRAQAELLTAWFITLGRAQIVPPTIPGGPQRIINSAEIGLINASEVVVYDLVIAAICEPHEPLRIGLTKVTDPVAWDEERDRVVLGRVNVLQPGQSTTRIGLATTSLVPKDLHLFFRDHKGVYWWRGPRGTLTEQQTPENDSAKSRYAQISIALGHPANGERATYLTINHQHPAT